MFSFGFFDPSLSPFYSPETSENINNSYINDSSLDNDTDNKLINNINHDDSFKTDNENSSIKNNMKL